jgi:hypothetical protein
VPNGLTTIKLKKLIIPLPIIEGAPGLNYNEVKERVIPFTNNYGGTSAKGLNYNKAKERVVPGRNQGSNY